MSVPHTNNRYIGNFMDKRETIDFRANSEMVYNKRVRSLRGSIQGKREKIRGVEVGGGRTGAS